MFAIPDRENGRPGPTDHEQVVFCQDHHTGLKAIIGIYSTALGPALGGTRFYPYGSEDEALADVLRLSAAMAYKNALAGLDHGGGKAVIIGDPAQIKTEPLLRAYGRFVASLGGRYVTACDVGTRSEDMDIIARECRYVTGRTIANGGAGDSSVLTAMGVMHGMRAAAEHAWGSTSLRGRTVGVEGVGKVGHRLVDHLLEAGAEVVICDVSADAIEAVRARHPEVRAVADVEALIAENLDILAPCALGGTLTDRVVNTLTARSSAVPPTTSWPITASRNYSPTGASSTRPTTWSTRAVSSRWRTSWPALISIVPAPPPSRSSLPPRKSSPSRTPTACRHRSPRTS